MILIKGNVERLVTDEAQAEKLRKDGYKGLAHDPAEVEGAAEKGLVDMTVSELRAQAKEQGIDGAGSLTKAELLAVLKDVSLNDRN